MVDIRTQNINYGDCESQLISDVKTTSHFMLLI